MNECGALRSSMAAPMTQFHLDEVEHPHVYGGVVSIGSRRAMTLLCDLRLALVLHPGGRFSKKSTWASSAAYTNRIAYSSWPTMG